MDNLNVNSKILYTNAKNFGIDLVSLYKSSANLISKKIVESYGVEKHYSIICGLGGNGGDGFAIAEELSKTSKVTVYLVGRSNNIEDPVAFDLWNNLKRSKSPNLILKQDCYAEDITSTDVVIECLIGTGLVGKKLNKRFGDIIKRISHFKKITLAIDAPSPSYKPDLTISLIYPKTQDAEVVNIDLPKELTMYPGPGEVEVLFKAKKHSYKAKNGKLLYIYNSDTKTNLEKIIRYSEDYYVHVNIYSLKSNPKQLEGENISYINEEDLEESIISSDTIFLDEFSGESLLNKAIISEILNYTDKKFILSNSSIRFIPEEKLKPIKEKVFILNKDTLSIDTKGEKGYKRTAIELAANIIVPSIQSYLYSNTGEFRLDISGKLFNKELQQELLCLTAVLSTKNDIWLSLRAADFMLISL
ncbi:MAG: NAD(P)H-hydrate epimerase [Candidatus Dojkabacteria bacterium]